MTEREQIERNERQYNALQSLLRLVCTVIPSALVLRDGVTEADLPRGDLRPREKEKNDEANDS